jgi:menaquinone-dependent protoporphyrinogen oxidase
VLPVHRVPEDFDPFDYDGVLVGGSIHGRRYQQPLLRWVQVHQLALAALPSALFTVCMRAAVPTAEARREVEGYVAAFVRESGWRPDASAPFAGALRYSANNPLLRWVMKRIVRKDAAHLPGATDTARDHEFTDWAAVDAFADAFAHRLTAAEAQRPLEAA